MPLVKCTTKEGKAGWKWGEKNTSCFASKKKALEQGRAIEANKHKKAQSHSEILQAIASELEIQNLEKETE